LSQETRLIIGIHIGKRILWPTELCYVGIAPAHPLNDYDKQILPAWKPPMQAPTCINPKLLPLSAHP